MRSHGLLDQFLIDVVLVIVMGAFFEQEDFKLRRVLFKRSHDQLLELFCLQPISQILHDVVHQFFICIEFPVSSFYQSFVLLLHLFDHDAQRTLTRHQDLGKVLNRIGCSGVLDLPELLEGLVDELQAFAALDFGQLDGVVEANQHVSEALQLHVDLGQEQPYFKLVVLDYRVCHEQGWLVEGSFAQVFSLVVKQVRVLWVLGKQAEDKFQAPRALLELQVELCKQDAYLGRRCVFLILLGQFFDDFDRMPHQFPINHVPEHQTKAVTALHVCLAFELTSDVDVLLEAGPEQDRIEVPQLLKVIFAVVEEVIVPAPRQIRLIHGAED